MVHPELLHEDYYKTPYDEAIRDDLAMQLDNLPQRLNPLPVPPKTEKLPDITVLAQSYKDTSDDIERLLNSIEAQDYPGEQVHTVIISAGSIWRGVERVTKERGATLVGMSSEPSRYFRSRLMREGLRVAPSDLVFTTVGHAALSNKKLLRVAAHYSSQKDFGGAFGLPLRDRGSTWAEGVGARVLGLHTKVRRGPVTMRRKPGFGEGTGLMAADCSVLSRSLVQELDGFDNSYGFGGNDGRFGRKLLANGLKVHRDPLLSVFHTDALPAHQALRLAWRWSQMGQDHDFVIEDWAWHPHGGL